MSGLQAARVRALLVAAALHGTAVHQVEATSIYCDDRLVSAMGAELDYQCPRGTVGGCECARMEVNNYFKAISSTACDHYNESEDSPPMACYFTTVAEKAGSNEHNYVCSNASSWTAYDMVWTFFDVKEDCALWGARYFWSLTNVWTKEDCLDPINLTLATVTGHAILTRVELMAYTAREGGCCDEPEWTGSLCEDLVKDWSDYCPSSYTPQAASGWTGGSVLTFRDADNLCIPCYGYLDNNTQECRQCWEADVSGCLTEGECSGAGGQWDAALDSCSICSKYHTEGCTQASCQSSLSNSNGTWQCDAGNTSSCHCMLCDPLIDTSGCNSSQCSSLGLGWACNDEGCSCGKCCLTKSCNTKAEAGARYCSPSECVGEDLTIDTWTDSTGFANYTECVRCSNLTVAGEVSAEGCMSMSTCERFAYFSWLCPEDTGRGKECCWQCSVDSYEGCKTEEECKMVFGQWCTDGRYGCHHSCDPVTPPTPATPPSPSAGTCHTLTNSQRVYLQSINMKPSGCADSTGVASWGYPSPSYSAPSPGFQSASTT